MRFSVYFPQNIMKSYLTAVFQYTVSPKYLKKSMHMIILVGMILGIVLFTYWLLFDI